MASDNSLPQVNHSVQGGIQGGSHTESVGILTSPYSAIRVPLATDLVVFNSGQVTRTTSEGAGAGGFCDLFSFYSHVGSHTTHCDGEIEAIHLALHQLSDHLSTPNKAVILSNSSFSLQALASNQYKQSFQVQDCKELLSTIPTKAEYKKCFRDAPTITAKNKSWRMLVKLNCVLDFPRAAAVAEFRLLTGNDCLCAHLYRFNLTDFPFCVLCASGQVMDASHLDVCSVLQSLDFIVKKYGKARCLMT
ncbi:uncharacterized protein TNCV_1376071 [Trichonephila clavipes]|nr:uncharacterized protein TNCV_1376071 [Trichonephila clavipes]